jgi:translation initiation factor IF-2
MAVGQRLSKVARELNVGISTINEFLNKKGIEMDANPNAKVSDDIVGLLKNEFRQDLNVKKASEELIDRKAREKKEAVTIRDIQEDHDDVAEEALTTRVHKNMDVKVVGKIDLNRKTTKTEAPKIEAVEGKNSEAAPVEKVKPKVETTAVEIKEVDEDIISKHKAKVVEHSPKVEHESKVEYTPKVENKPMVEHAPKVENTPNVAHTPKVENKPKVEHIPIRVDKPAESPKVVGKIDLDAGKKEKEIKKENNIVAEKKDQEQPITPKVKVSQRVTETTAESKQQEVKASQSEKPAEQPKVVEAKQAKVSDSTENFMPTKVKKLSGPTVVGKIELPVNRNSERDDRKNKKKKRKRIKKDKERVNINATATKPPHVAGAGNTPNKGGQHSSDKQQPHNKPAQQQVNRKRAPLKVKKRPVRAEVSEEDVAKQIKDTLARLTSKGKSKSSRHRRDKRDLVSIRHQEEIERQDEEKKILRVTEFVTANEMANLMEVQVNQIIATCMSLGLFVSINQRLDAETITLVGEEFGYKVEFISVGVAEAINEEVDSPEDLLERPPIVTVMGHVDHGKTSLLDYIRKSNVSGGEAGGITQHIGAYGVKLDNGRQITFLDTPGHEAFTAMRARGAQVTDIAIIIIAANDNVMPQTIEAINHASAAGVPIVFAISKIDVPGANPDRVRESLASMNYLVEEWGGKYQCQEISAKHGTNVKQLLEKVLLEADLLELKANPNKPAIGNVIESTLDKGRGYVATLLVQAGTLKVGDLVLSGSHFGRVKAMFNERNQQVVSVGPSEPVLVLGLNGAPQAGEKFNVMENERETKDIATKRQQIQREQGMRAQKHITLDEIGRRIAIGNFQELNLIVKGDVDGSIEALSDSVIKLSTEEIQVNVIHKAVGGISESDIMLAAASNAIVIGFQVRPSISARRLAEREEIDIRLYSIIYDAIEEIKAAMEGMLSPEIKEQIVSTVEVRETFKITKVGTIAGCMVKEGKIKRSSKVRVIRDGIVIYSGDLGSLKRFKDDVKEVVSGFECGLNINNFNDIKVGDLIEAYEQIEVSRKL